MTKTFPTEATLAPGSGGSSYSRQTSLPMKYHDGSTISLGDIVRVAVPGGTGRARVVMLGDSREHLDIDKQFLAWVERDDKLLEPNYVVVEFLDRNPFAHNDPQYAPVGNYTFSPTDSGLTRDV